MKTKLAVLITTAFALSAVTAAQNGPTIGFDTVLINTDPVPVDSGEDAEINFKVRNTGDSEADNVRVQIMDSYPFSLKPDRKRNYSLGSVTPGEEYQISSEVLIAEDAPDGENDFKVRISSGDFTVEKKIPVNVQSEDIELNLANMKTTPSTLRPDTEDNTMILEVVNNGDKTAENVVLELDLPSSFEETSSFSTRQALGNIDVGELKSAEFNFDISENATAGEVEIPASLSYSASDDTAEITREVSFSTFISGKPQFKIVSSESDLSVDEKGEIRLEVRNTGSEKSDSTRVRILDNSDLPFSFTSSSKFMGSLRPGTSGEVVFDTTVESDAVAKQYLMDFEIRGVKGSEVFVEEKVRGFEVSGSEEETGLPLLPIIAVIIGLGGAVYYFRDRVLH